MFLCDETGFLMKGMTIYICMCIYIYICTGSCMVTSQRTNLSHGTFKITQNLRGFPASLANGEGCLKKICTISSMLQQTIQQSMISKHSKSSNTSKSSKMPNFCEHVLECWNSKQSRILNVVLIEFWGDVLESCSCHKITKSREMFWNFGTPPYL